MLYASTPPFRLQLEKEEEVVGYEVIGALILTQLVIRYYSKSNERIRQETASAALTDGDAIMAGHCFSSASATGT
ncbi:hypothetical protein SeLEV6574_g07204 [Synchytrium endobioticum]|uniref:Uncharacterized protein n=1 Tax=Synchytrium endobioticum TaxID=286115 RepID=A0A507CLF4_9FUNG|nr:hypothetical protein SeLEV6574_g07204 [Synchytrium endobioticum]